MRAFGRAPKNVDGISLLPYLADPAQADALAGRYEASGIIDEAAVYYELDRESGWVQFRKARLSALMSQKQRAAMSSNTLLAAIPGPPGQGPR